MQPYQSSRVDLVELRTQIVKKVGVERSKKYFYYLNRFLSQKLSKSEFDKSCFRFLGRENLPLHNNLICSILKNACQAKTPPPNYEAGPTKSLIQASKDSPIREDGHEQIGSLIPNQSMPIRSNGILPVSPRKVRSATRDHKLRDRPSSLGPNGKVECISHRSIGTEDNGSKFVVENGELAPCDYQRPVQHLPTVAEQPENERDGSAQWPIERPKTQKDQTAFVEDRDEVEQAHHLSFSRSPLLAPLGIPYCSASMGGARKAMPVTSSGDFVSYYDSGGLSGTEMLRKRMEQIADVQGLGGVTTECANTLNKMLDVYLKRLIKSCVELVGAQSPCGPRKYTVHKQQVQNKVVNGMWPSNRLHMQSSSSPVEGMQEQRPHSSISMLDFKVAMELNPQQLGEDWPLLLEKICMQSFED
ncbi:hypothetical protein OIU76_008622 [Salix suchowensis]|nr:hypothetical protein OIU76_008622 [Salix suchowensis]